MCGSPELEPPRFPSRRSVMYSSPRSAWVWRKCPSVAALVSSTVLSSLPPYVSTIQPLKNILRSSSVGYGYDIPAMSLREALKSANISSVSISMRMFLLNRPMMSESNEIGVRAGSIGSLNLNAALPTLSGFGFIKWMNVEF